ncbi:MAG TPA: hypothetical protein DCZ94_12910, partial [Lentisphaeria bacterium]|nr:hypothetical protein [Lentisphaeria bacterium]
MKKFKTLILISAALLLSHGIFAQNQKAADQIKAEKTADAGNAGKKSAPQTAEEDAPWVAVHDFSIAPSLADWGLNGWDIAEKFENELTQKAFYRMITRAKIAKVLKEQKVSSSGALEASKFGAMVGADYIVTGQIDKKGSKFTIIAKLIDAKKETGKILKSYDISMRIAGDKESLSGLHRLIEILSAKLSMGPGDLLDYGIARIKDGNFEEAAESFHEIEKSIPLDEIKKLMNLYGRDAPIPLPRELKSPGEALDYGLAEMKKGNQKEAVTAFTKIKESGATTEIRNFLELHDALKKVEAKLKEQQDKLKSVLSEADRLYLLAKTAQDKAESEMTPGELCDKALLLLETMIADQKNLSDDSKIDIEDMINKIKSFKTNVAGGPTPGKKWNVPDLKMSFVPIAPGTFTMGLPDADDDAENKAHSVTLTKPFWMGQHEVTIGQFLFYLQNPTGDGNE